MFHRIGVRGRDQFSQLRRISATTPSAATLAPADVEHGSLRIGPLDAADIAQPESFVGTGCRRLRYRQFARPDVVQR